MIAAAYKAVQDDNEEALRRIVATCADAPVREHVLKKYKKGYFFLQIVGNGSIFLECNQVWELWDKTPNYIENAFFFASSLKLSTREHGAEYISTVPIAFFNLLHGLT